MSALSPQVCVQAETHRFVRLGHRRLPLAAVNDVMKRMKHAHNRTEETQQETSRDGGYEWNELGNIVILERRTPARVH